MPKVMFITNSLSGGGAERSTNSTANQLALKGWKVLLVPINGEVPLTNSLNCEIHPILRNQRAGVFSTFRAFLRLNWLAIRWKPDFVIANCELPELMVAFLITNPKIVVVQHTSFPWMRHRSMGRVVRNILNLRKCIWCGVSDHLVIWPFSKSVNCVFPNPLDHVAPPALNSTSIKLSRLLFIGRLSPEKHPQVAIEIATKLGLELEIVGEGALIQQLKELSSQLKCSSTFHGYLSNPWQIYEKGDLLIVPSIFEGDGLVILEAMQRSVPMLIADIPDFRRFNFPESIYCANLDQFVERALNNSENIGSFLIPRNLSSQILASRELSNTVPIWESFLNMNASK